MSEAGFRLLVSAKRAELLDSAAGQLTALMRSAASTLKLLLKSSSDAVRLGASKAILDAAISMKTVIELERRVLDLEHRP